MKLLRAVVLMVIAPTALAGLNGQQISFRAPGADLDRVRISGDNQDDRAVRWDSSWKGIVCNAARCDQVRAEDWWFKGRILVRYRLRNDRHTYACYYYVNERQAGDWVNLVAPNIEPDGQGFRYREPGKAAVKCAIDR
jgi:hypothetical protein